MFAIMGNPNPLLLEADTEKRLDKSLSAEQPPSPTFTPGWANSRHEDDSYDSDGKPWHDGVLQIRAITTMWSKSSMWSMFAL